MTLSFRFVVAILLLPVALSAGQPMYETDVRPILKAACFHCHGEEDEIQAQLDLRLRRLIAAGGDSGAAIIPGNANKSLLLERLVSGEMPPGDKKLSAVEIDLIRAWIDAGAPTVRPEPETVTAFTQEEKDFWSFQPIKRPDVPTFDSGEVIQTPVDAFVLRRLQENGLNFSTPADRVTLIRRIYFDLIGLPPTPEQIDAFVADDQPNAFERVVDELLASPHYGERWGRHWLDVAGYADSEGFTEADTERSSAFRYRDYVICSLNTDKPFDVFIQEQLAGDEMISGELKNLAEEDIEKLTATGFLRMAPDGTGDSGVDQNLARNQVMAETMKIVSTALMGMTVGCAECHNHRYDPIRQSDYYAMRAIFEPALNWKKWKPPKARLISLYTDEDRKVAAEIEAQAKVVDEEYAALTKTFIAQTLDAQLLKLPQEVREPLKVAYNTAAGERTDEQKELLDKYPKILKISAGSLYLYDREIRTDAAKIDAERKKKEQEFIAQAMMDSLSKLTAEEQGALKSVHATPADKRTAEQKSLLEVHGDKIVTAANLEQFAPEAAAELKRLEQDRNDLLATLKADRLKELQEKAKLIRETKPPEHFVRALVEPAGDTPETFVFHRGDFEQPKEKVSPAGLAVLQERKLVEVPDDTESIPTSGRRLAFAARLTDGKHPLTARVLVNRFWLHHFGRGIVETPGDFGQLGERPTHPELLDWLASEFVAGGWKLKTFHKLIAMSRTYQQAAVASETAQVVDPDNRLYSHMSIRRMDAETVRDAILQISGKLNSKMFGEPVPVMEDIVGQIVIGKENLDGERKPLAAIDLQGEEFRRSIYIQARRSRPLAVLSTFDLPQMEPNCTGRTSSTVTPQALMLMNSDFVAEYASLLADRVKSDVGESNADRCARAWRLIYGSVPGQEEVNGAVEFVQRQSELYLDNKPADSKTSADDLALASFCQALLSSNGFLYVD